MNAPGWTICYSTSDSGQPPAARWTIRAESLDAEVHREQAKWMMRCLRQRESDQTPAAPAYVLLLVYAPRRQRVSANSTARVAGDWRATAQDPRRAVLSQPYGRPSCRSSAAAPCCSSRYHKPLVCQACHLTLPGSFTAEVPSDSGGVPGC